MDHIRVARLFGQTLLMKPHLVSVYKRWVVVKMCPVEHCWLRLAVLEMNDKPVNSALNEALHWRRLWSSSRLHRRQWERWYIWQNSAFWKARAARIPWHCKSKVKDDAPDYCVSSRKQKCPKAQWNLSLNPKTVTLPKSSWNTTKVGCCTLALPNTAGVGMELTWCCGPLTFAIPHMITMKGQFHERLWA